LGRIFHIWTGTRPYANPPEETTMNKPWLWVMLYALSAPPLSYAAVFECTPAIYAQATAYAKSKYAHFDASKYKCQYSIVSDDLIQVEYTLPDDYKGGAPVVILDKRTLKLIRIFHTQ
jgi:hypothetical protein